MSDRSLSSLGLPISTLSVLERFGYDTVSDLSKSTPEDLSRGMFYPGIHPPARSVVINIPLIYFLIPVRSPDNPRGWRSRSQHPSSSISSHIPFPF